MNNNPRRSLDHAIGADNRDADVAAETAVPTRYSIDNSRLIPGNVFDSNNRGTANTKSNSSNNNGTNSDEESIILEWEDDQGCEIRHLFSSPMPTMTQQIDAAMQSSSSSSSESESENDGENNNNENEVDNTAQKQSRRRSKRLQTNNSNSEIIVGLNNAKKTSLNNKGSIQLNSNTATGSNGKEERTPPPSSKKRQLNSGEVPATISKLKRSRRRPVSRKVTISPLLSGDVNNNSNAINNNDQNSSDRKKMGDSKDDNQLNEKEKLQKQQQLKKVSASQEVDRVFDILGIGGDDNDDNDEKQKSQSSNSHRNQEEILQHKLLRSASKQETQHTHQHHQQQQYPPLLHSLDVSLDECNINETVDTQLTTSSSPMGSRRLFEHDENKNIANKQHHQQHHQEQSHHAQKQIALNEYKVKLPPLRPLGSDSKKNNLLQHICNSKKEKDNSHAKGNEVDIENDEEDEDGDIWKEIEMGLDRVDQVQKGNCDASSSLSVNGGVTNTANTLAKANDTALPDFPLASSTTVTIATRTTTTSISPTSVTTASKTAAKDTVLHEITTLATSVKTGNTYLSRNAIDSASIGMKGVKSLNDGGIQVSYKNHVPLSNQSTIRTTNTTSSVQSVSSNNVTNHNTAIIHQTSEIKTSTSSLVEPSATIVTAETSNTNINMVSTNSSSNASKQIYTKVDDEDAFNDFDFDVDDQELANMDAQVASLTQQRNVMDQKKVVYVSQMLPPPSLDTGGGAHITNHSNIHMNSNHGTDTDINCNPNNNTGKSSNSNNNEYEFEDDDDWDDEELAKIDLKVSMTQSAASAHLPNNAIKNPNALSNNNDISTNQSAQGFNVPQNNGSYEFSDDDDFAGVDFTALDNKIVQHKQQQMTQGMDCHPRSFPPPLMQSQLPPPPPLHAPIHNRLHVVLSSNSPTSATDKSPTTSYLSFTRYVIRRVQDNVATYTKTIAVGLWSPKEEISDNNELVRLRKICDQNNNNFSSYSDNNAHTIDGCIHLCGEWYHTQCHVGDVVHLCSVSGRYITDTSALPVVLHTNPPEGSDTQDDLLLVIHPDVLISPTLVSEAVKCPRLAVLQSRFGSTGLSAKAAVIGTLRHDLFERCLRDHDASRRSAVLYTREIIRNQAESLVGCGIVNQTEAYNEVMKILPQIQTFLNTYTSWNATKTGQMKLPSNNNPNTVLKGMFASCDTMLSIEGVYSTEEWAMVPELGLKGNVDATVLARTKPLNPNMSPSCGADVQDSLMPVELKTGHVQNTQHSHLAQLSVYTLMLRARHGSATSGVKQTNADGSNGLDGVEIGAASSGMLLYLNHESISARHVRPLLSDAKTLIGQRNGVVCDVLRAARPRGVEIEYEDDIDKNGTSLDMKKESRVVAKSPPPSSLPPLLPSVGSCERCYKNRECMMYTSADALPIELNAPPPTNGAILTHGKLIHHFTGHLNGPDLDYFRKWDRLIDLERHASTTEAAKSWLFDSSEKEANDGKCIGGLLLDEAVLSAAIDEPKGSSSEEEAVVRFSRSNESGTRTPLLNLNFETGSYVIISTDDTLFTSQTQSIDQGDIKGRAQRTFRHKMHLLRGSVNRVMENSIDITIPQKDVARIKRLLPSGHSSNTLMRQRSGIHSNESLKFRLDRDELNNGTGLLLQNLCNFFTLDIPPFSAESFGQSQVKTKQLTMNTDYSARRRRMNSFIVQLSPPPRFTNITEESLFFCPSFSQGIPGCDEGSLKQDFDKLNLDQKGAVLKVVSAEDFTLIQGLPGTGKSATIAFLTRLLVARGKRVMLTSYTHSAVDNLLCKLIESGVECQENMPNPIVRIGRESGCHPKVHSLLAHNIACAEEKRTSRSKDLVEKPSVDHLSKVISSAKVVGVTALTAQRSPLLAGQHFDIVIVDEAGQISQPAVLGAIMAADSFVLVGDHMQLPPLVCSEVAEQAGYGVSMLMHLAEGFPDSVAKLTMQYRMHEDICHLSNKIAYKGLLKCGNDEVRYGKLRLANFPPNTDLINLIDRNWLEHAIDPEKPVVFLDTDGMSCSWQGPGHSNFKGLESEGPINAVELSISQRIIQALTICGLNASSIGMITPFRSQLRLLSEDFVLRQYKSDGLEICTIDRFQGRDKPVIIFSLVRSNKEGKSGRLLHDFRRLNVAFSRAKQKLIIIGSYSTLHRGSDVMRPVLESIRERNWIQKLSQIS